VGIEWEARKLVEDIVDRVVVQGESNISLMYDGWTEDAEEWEQWEDRDELEQLDDMVERLSVLSIGQEECLSQGGEQTLGVAVGVAKTNCNTPGGAGPHLKCSKITEYFSKSKKHRLVQDWDIMEWEDIPSLEEDMRRERRRREARRKELSWRHRRNCRQDLLDVARQMLLDMAWDSHLTNRRAATRRKAKLRRDSWWEGERKRREQEMEDLSGTGHVVWGHTTK
jgi:hypothetical protein